MEQREERRKRLATTAMGTAAPRRANLAARAPLTRKAKRAARARRDTRELSPLQRAAATQLKLWNPPLPSKKGLLFCQRRKRETKGTEKPWG